MRLINADEFLKRIEWLDEYDFTLYREIKRYLDEMPTIDIETIRHGKWVHTGFMEIKCSDCGNVFHELEDTNYCPSCGAKMIPTIPKEIIDAVLGEDEVDDEDN